jgi:8-oxo-dGTP pyrophosphatase MutT (NUDIX family)
MRYSRHPTDRFDARAMLHPFADDAGLPVTIHRPSTATPLTAWNDPAQVATVVPGGALPATLNGIPLVAAACPAFTTPAPGCAEPPFVAPHGLQAAAGAVIVEPDGRIWLVAPTNAHGGYAATFPKGRVDPGASLAATAVREAWEEAGLVVEVTAHLIDVRRTQTYTRYYLARRAGGSPAAMGWETQAVHLVPAGLLAGVAAHRNDAAIIALLTGG